MIRLIQRRGALLPITMTLLAGLMALTVILLITARSSTTTTQAFSEQYQVELVSESALAVVHSKLKRMAQTDAFAVVRQGDYLYAALPTQEESQWQYEYLPLFSYSNVLENTPFLKHPEFEILEEDAVQFRPQAWMEERALSWNYIQDEQGKDIARYAYWIDDEQAYLDLKHLGNRDGVGEKHQRSVYPEFAAGDFKDKNQVALYVLDPGSRIDDSGNDSLEDHIIQSRKRVRSFDDFYVHSIKQPSFQRDTDGHFWDHGMRSIEENAVYDLRPYKEQQLIPLLFGISSDQILKPKQNLNHLVQQDDAVEAIADHIDRSLPLFSTERKGGFPEDYTKTLAASMVDFVDADSNATFKEGEYRGIDAYPLLTEYLYHFEWLNPESEQDVKLRLKIYGEFWNMTTASLSGTLEMPFETNYFIKDQSDQSHFLAQQDVLQSDGTTHDLILKKDRFFFPSVEFGSSAEQKPLRSGEHRVIKLAEIEYTLPFNVRRLEKKDILIEGDASAQSKYEVYWDGVLVDRSAGGISRPNVNLKRSKKSRRQGRLIIPASRHGVWPDLHYNIGDVRMSYYLNSSQRTGTFPDEYSPNRRNVQLDNISGTGKEKRIDYRTLVSQWPDGGHDSDFGSMEFHSKDKTINPDDARFKSKPSLSQVSAPTVLSQRGYYTSVTELGHIYDPIMWNVGAGRTNPSKWHDITMDAEPDDRYGGGNTLRIGRPEHSRFDKVGLRASNLLDLFHVSDTEEDRSSVKTIQSRININTATRDTLRALFAGSLQQDPMLAKQGEFDRAQMAPKTESLQLSAPSHKLEADLLADAIIAARPFISVSELAHIKDAKGKPVFGSAEQYSQAFSLQWSDRAREELFARAYDNSCVRSRNFKVYVIGQVIRKRGDGKVMVLAEDRRQQRVFVDPDERAEDGSLIPENTRIKVRELRIR